MIKNSNEMRD